MNRVSVYFYSQHGQTEKIARRICRVFETANWTAILCPVAHLPQNYRIAATECIVVCAPIIAGRYDQKLLEIMSRNRDILSNSKSAFVSVSLSAHGTEQQKREAAKVAGHFLEMIGWKPSLFLNAAGELAYRKYNFLIRFIMKHISKKAGGPIVTNQNYEFTDWNEVDAFANDLLKDASQPRFQYAPVHSENKTLITPIPAIHVAEQNISIH